MSAFSLARACSVRDRARTGAPRNFDRFGTTAKLKLDHVQIVAPPGGVDEAIRFYGEILGLQQIERPRTMSGTGAWFRVGAQELHVSEHDDFVPARKAHPAFALAGADLEALAARLGAAGAEVTWDGRLPGTRRFYTCDPAGNRLEFLARPGRARFGMSESPGRPRAWGE